MRENFFPQVLLVFVLSADAGHFGELCIGLWILLSALTAAVAASSFPQQEVNGIFPCFLIPALPWAVRVSVLLVAAAFFSVAGNFPLLCRCLSCNS
jgi:hypothetical protein